MDRTSMRIAFDLDDTLLPAMHGFATERPVRRLLSRLLVRTRLRLGATRMLKALLDRGHEIWIYTTSCRSRFHIRCLFDIPGVRISGIVTGDSPAPAGPCCSKYPPGFGIDVLVDDSPGVRMEGEEHGFCVIHLDPNDENWVAKVLSKIDDLSRRRTEQS
jgi:hypothetical protein